MLLTILVQHMSYMGYCVLFWGEVLLLRGRVVFGYFNIFVGMCFRSSFITLKTIQA